MIDVFMERYYRGGDCTLGRLWAEGELINTLELPWLENEPNISCIPEGTYEVEMTYSPKFKKNLWLIKDVPNRSGIRIHTANYVSQLRGCIAPGLGVHDLNGDGILDVTNSKKALSILNDVLPDKFILDILWNRTLEQPIV
jgi:hypothetical protein